MKRGIITAIAAVLCVLLMGFLWLQAQIHVGCQVGIKFVGFTNNSAGLLGLPDKTLAVFSVTNGAASPVEPTSFYYIETHGCWSSYAPLGSSGRIAPHSCGTILTRIPTNGTPWRVIIPYSRTNLPVQIADAIRDALEDALKRPKYDFRRYGKGAPTSDWVKP